jgi:hypothetical protein
MHKNNHIHGLPNPLRNRGSEPDGVANVDVFVTDSRCTSADSVFRTTLACRQGDTITDALEKLRGKFPEAVPPYTAYT